MELTPIKISGKRKAPSSQEEKKSRKAAKNSHAHTLTGNPERNEIQTKSTKHKKRSLKNIKSRRKMSHLEALPTELLEKVFLYCFNVEFPRSSPVIAGRLSNQMIYFHTTMAAFSPTWNYWQSRKIADLQHNPSFTEPASFQSKVLSCRWSCMAIILKAKSAWMKQTGAQLSPLWFITANDTNRLTYPYAVSCTALTIEKCFRMDFECFSEYCRQEPPNTDIWRPVNFSITRDIEKSVEIPESLLTGPWTVKQLEFLFWIVKAGAQINFVSSTSGEVALDGLKTAVTSGNTTAIVLLCWLGVSRKINEALLSWALRNAGGNKVGVLLHLLLSLESMQQCMEYPDIPSDYVDEYKVDRELMILKDEAMRSRDKELLALSERLSKSTTLRLSLQRRRHFEETGHWTAES